MNQLFLKLVAGMIGLSFVMSSYSMWALENIATVSHMFDHHAGNYTPHQHNSVAKVSTHNHHDNIDDEITAPSPTSDREPTHHHTLSTQIETICFPDSLATKITLHLSDIARAFEQSHLHSWNHFKRVERPPRQA